MIPRSSSTYLQYNLTFAIRITRDVADLGSRAQTDSREGPELNEVGACCTSHELGLAVTAAACMRAM
jgi:hypothetical protein